MYPILTYGSEEQKTALAAETAIGRSHRLLRIDRARFRLESRRHATTAEKRGDHWVLNGEKTWITNGIRGRRRGGLGAHRRGHSRISGGERHAGIQHLRYSRQAVHARFGDLEPALCRLPRSGVGDCCLREGVEGAAGCLSQARFGIGWGVIGAAMDCYETARAIHDHAQTVRRQDRSPAHQLVQEKLAWMITEITKAQLLALHVGRLKDQRQGWKPRTFPC